MWRIFFAVVIGTLLQVGIAFAAGPFDGEWKGSSRPKKGCATEEMALKITDGAVSGERVIGGGSPGKIGGRVTPDGTLKGNHGRLTGEFSGDKATVVFHTDEKSCADLTFSLDKVK